MNLGLSLSLGGMRAGEPVTPWILATGAWDDVQPWVDTETWKDAA
jgi:hypothetical protein